MTACTTSAECAEITTGCCGTMMVESVAEDSIWGVMEPIVAGQTNGVCVSAEW